MPDPEQRSEIAGRSPLQIAFARLRADKIAMAVSRGRHLLLPDRHLRARCSTRLFGVEVRAGDPSTDTDIFNFPVIGPPDHPFTWEAPLGLAPEHRQRQPRRVALRRPDLAQHRHDPPPSSSTIIGITVGLIAGFSRGWLDRFISFVIDSFLSLPFLLMALAAGADHRRCGSTTSPNLLKFAQVISLIVHPDALRLDDAGPADPRRGALAARARVRPGRPRDGRADAADPVQGAAARTWWRRSWCRSRWPCRPSWPPRPAWPTSASASSACPRGGRPSTRPSPYFDTYPLYLYAPVLGIFLLVVALNLLGDAIRDAFDPKTRR